jgi:hypothetical protein
MENQILIGVHLCESVSEYAFPPETLFNPLTLRPPSSSLPSLDASPRALGSLRNLHFGQETGRSMGARRHPLLSQNEKMPSSQQPSVIVAIEPRDSAARRPKESVLPPRCQFPGDDGGSPSARRLPRHRRPAHPDSPAESRSKQRALPLTARARLSKAPLDFWAWILGHGSMVNLSPETLAASACAVFNPRLSALICALRLRKFSSGPLDVSHPEVIPSCHSLAPSCCHPLSFPHLALRLAAWVRFAIYTSVRKEAS